MTTSALNARAKLFVPGVGIVTPERGGARAREGAARNPFEDDDRLATTARAKAAACSAIQEPEGAPAGVGCSTIELRAEPGPFPPRRRVPLEELQT